MSDRRQHNGEQSYYLVKIHMPVQRLEYIVRANGYDEAARKAIEADTIRDGTDDGDAEPGGIKSIEEYGDLASVVL